MKEGETGLVYRQADRKRCTARSRSPGPYSRTGCKGLEEYSVGCHLPTEAFVPNDTPLTQPSGHSQLLRYPHKLNINELALFAEGGGVTIDRTILPPTNLTILGSNGQK